MKERLRPLPARLAAASLVGGAVLLSGCIMIPVDYAAYGSRQNITDTSAADFRPGITSREEVLLALGEPEVVSEDQRSFGYAWSRVKVIWAVGSYGGGAVGDFAQQKFLRISFDEHGRFQDASLSKHWAGSAAR